MAILHVKSPNGSIIDFPLKDYLPLAGGRVSGDVKFLPNLSADPDSKYIKQIIIPHDLNWVKGDSSLNDIYFTHFVAVDSVFTADDVDDTNHRLGLFETGLSCGSNNVFSKMAAYRFNTTGNEMASLEVLSRYDSTKAIYNDENKAPLINTNTTSNFMYTAWSDSAGRYRCMRYEDGLEILGQQEKSHTTAGSAKTITFKYAFTTVPMVFIGPLNKYKHAVTAISKTNFTLQVQSGADVWFQFIAIGRWK